MGIMSRLIVAIEFKLGTLKARQIIRVENGGLVISSSDARYQPGPGIRYELTPDDWFLHTYAFFPMGYSLDAYERGDIKDKVYYDYYSEQHPISPRHGDSHRYIYAIFKSGHDTGYRIVEMRRSESHGGYSEWVDNWYYGLHINEWGISRYKTTTKSYMQKPFKEARHIHEAAIYMMSDLEEFEREYIKLNVLKSDCERDPGSCVLHDQLAVQLNKCRHASKYIATND